MKPLSAKQLDQARRQRLSGRERRFVESAVAIAADRDVVADDLRRLQQDLADLERSRPVAWPDREKVLVVIEGDGLVRVHAADWVDVHVAHLPAVDPACERLMALAEEIARYQMPGVYRELLEAKPRGSGHVQGCRTPAELARQAVHHEALDAVERILKALDKGA